MDYRTGSHPTSSFRMFLYTIRATESSARTEYRRLVHGSPLSLMLDAHREIHNNATPFMVVPFVSLVVAIHPFIAPFDIYIHHDFYDNGLES